MASERQGSPHVGAQRVLPFKQCLTWYLENNTAPGQDDRALLPALGSTDRSRKRRYGAQSWRIQSGTVDRLVWTRRSSIDLRPSN